MLDFIIGAVGGVLDFFLDCVVDRLTSRWKARRKKLGKAEQNIEGSAGIEGREEIEGRAEKQ